MMDVSSERARAAGLILTEPAITARDARACNLGAESAGFLHPDQEAELIRVARKG